MNDDFLTDESAARVWKGLSPKTWIVICESPVRLEFGCDAEGIPSICFGFKDSDAQDFFDSNVQESGGFYLDNESKINGGRSKIKYRMTETDPGLFYSFSSDLMRLAKGLGIVTQQECAKIIVGRIKAWQAFMKPSHVGLTPEAELGLFGELLILRKWLELGGVPDSLGGVWTGPMHGAHDFTFRNERAIEVKTTLNDKPLRVNIDSISQLDHSDPTKLILVVIKLRETEEGLTLKDLSGKVRALLKSAPLQMQFDSALLSLGYMVEHPGRELRRLSEEYLSAFVASSLPRIIRETVPGVVSVRYQIQLTNERGEPGGKFELEDLDKFLNEAI